MNSDQIVTQGLIDWLNMYNCLSPDDYNIYTQNIIDLIPFSIAYFINGKLKYVSYLQEDPVN